MRIIVAGAGAGKTTSMAKMVQERLGQITNGKIIYVITYTNAARDRIRELIIKLYGVIPKQIHIETLHVFLLREIIFPYHHLLYGLRLNKISLIKLSNNPRFKASKIKELRENKMIHVEQVTEIARWIVFKKTGDDKTVQRNREKIKAIITRCLDSVFIDEAQDMDEHLVKIIEVLNKIGVFITLIGDPKQDLRGRNSFKGMIKTYKQDVQYVTVNHRCPISHVLLANKYIPEQEKQIAESNEVGELLFVYESDIKCSSFYESTSWDQLFILKKTRRFITHEDDNRHIEHNLEYELKQLVKKVLLNSNEIDRMVYKIKSKVLADLKSNNFVIFRTIEGILNIKLDSRDMGKLNEAINLLRKPPKQTDIFVSSIDRVKGLEGKKCLFFVTCDIAAYLVGEKKEDNKVKNYLYVGLTRSRHTLAFLITQEVEKKYGKNVIGEFFESLKINQGNVN